MQHLSVRFSVYILRLGYETKRRGLFSRAIMKPSDSHNRREEITPPSQVRIQSVPNPHSDLLTYNKRAEKGTLSAAMRGRKDFSIRV